MLASVQMRATSLILYISVAPGLKLVAVSLGLKKHEECQSSIVRREGDWVGFSCSSNCCIGSVLEVGIRRVNLCL